MPRRARTKTTEVNDVYHDMLADVASSAARNDEDGRSVKKRRVAGRLVSRNEVAQSAPLKPEIADEPSSLDELFEEPISKQQFVVQSESEDSADSDVDWENVDLKDEANDNSDTDGSDSKDNTPARDLDLTLNKSENLHPAPPQRKPVTSLEKKLRLVIHKVNLCCLLTHLHIRNYWCNDQGAHVSS